MKNYRLLISLTLLVLLTSACQVVGPFLGSIGSGKVLFKDDFSDTESGWDQTLGAEGEANYKEGSYRILVSEANRDVFANPGKSFGDVSVEVDATKAAGPDQNDFGVICRSKDSNNYYFFIISSDGFFAIGKIKDGEQTSLGPEPDVAAAGSDKILKGDATNHIRADCVGDALTLYVNGEKLAEAKDSDFTSGDVGLMAGTFDKVGVDIRFDNFVVSRP